MLKGAGVEVVRSGIVESTHPVHAVVADHDGRVLTSVGEPDLECYLRSAAKPMQALPLVEEGVDARFGLSEEELALCCASHQSEQAHLDGVRSILSKAGLSESDLRCGPHVPFDRGQTISILREGRTLEPIHNNCSGKHAGMAALAKAMGWPVADYHRLDHPLQQRMLHEVSRWSHRAPDDINIGVDGCGVACFGLRMHEMAGAFARFAAAAADGGGPARIVHAMTGHPFMVGGTGRLCTDAMTHGRGRLFLKVGAEGLYCGGIPERGWGFAVKVGDGTQRAADVATMRVLECLDVLDSEASAALAEHGQPKVRNTLDEVVGSIRANFRLQLPRS